MHTQHAAHTPAAHIQYKYVHINNLHCLLNLSFDVDKTANMFQRKAVAYSTANFTYCVSLCVCVSVLRFVSVQRAVLNPWRSSVLKWYTQTACVSENRACTQTWTCPASPQEKRTLHWTSNPSVQPACINTHILTLSQQWVWRSLAEGT